THVVAFTRDGPVSRSAGDGSLTDGEGRRLAAILPQVGSEQPSWRLSDRVDGLAPEEQLRLHQGLGIALLVPLRWRGETVGAMLLGAKLTGMNHTGEDVTL